MTTPLTAEEIERRCPDCGSDKTEPLDGQNWPDATRGCKTCRVVLYRKHSAWLQAQTITLAAEVERLRGLVVEYLDVLDNSVDESETSSLREAVAPWINR